MSYKDSYIVSIYKVPGPVLDTGVSEMNRKQLLPVEVLQSAVFACTSCCSLFSPQFRPR